MIDAMRFRQIVVQISRFHATQKIPGDVRGTRTNAVVQNERGWPTWAASGEQSYWVRLEARELETAIHFALVGVRDESDYSVYAPR